MSAVVLQLERIGKTYPGPPPIEAVTNCSLIVHAGDHLAIVGPSGSGKSTLLNLIGLLDSPTCGTLTLLDRDVGRLSDADRTSIRGHHIGFVFQDFQLLPRRTAIENVSLAMVYRRDRVANRRQRCVEALERVGLSHRTAATPATMSGGERQRLAIARAVVTTPDLLLCDEPTGNLDSENTAAVLDLLDELNRQGLTVVVITHEREVADRAGRVLTMADGCLSETRSEPLDRSRPT